MAQYIPEELKDKEDINIFIVPDSVETLGLIGRANKHNAKEIVAIAGSRGKTTLKEMIFQLMEPFANISRSPRSYNSKIGVPLSLWQIPENTDLALIEAGVSMKGEMAHLEELIKPDTVIFTNIGEAHANGFESKKEKAGEKVRIAEGENVKTIIYTPDDINLKETIENISGNKNIIRWSLKDDKVELYITLNNQKGESNPELEYIWKEERHDIPVILDKPYDLENIAAALAFMLKEGIGHELIADRFKKLHRIKTRLNVSQGINGCSIIQDSYTSDLSSLLPAIDFMKRRKMPMQSMTLILSDLYHQGNEIDSTYREVAKIIAQTGIKKIIGVGESLKKYSHLFPSNSEFYKSTDDLLSHISASDFNDEIILLKGAPQYEFEKIYKLLEAKKHETVLEVNLDAMLRNYNYFRSLVPHTTGLIAMVKAFGYGVGSYEIAKTLQDAGASYLAVAALDEGIDLRENGISMPIMVMNPRSASYRALFNHRLQPVIYSKSMLKDLINDAKKYGLGEYPVHLKLDTGMHRMGFEEKDLKELAVLLKECDNIKVASVFSHLATADCPDMDSFTLRQLERFDSMSQFLIEELGYPVKRHILNSSGIIRFPAWHYDYVRLGIGLYGANTLPEEIEPRLSCVATLRSVIICIREVEPGEAVGYSRKGTINKKSRIATLPIGYADGIDRRFGNGAIKVLVNGKAAPTIGNICMDATMIDVTDIECNEGDTVEIFGEKIDISYLADTLSTIPYEILTSVSPRVKRVYYRE